MPGQKGEPGAAAAAGAAAQAAALIQEKGTVVFSLAIL